MSETSAAQGWGRGEAEARRCGRRRWGVWPVALAALLAVWVGPGAEEEAEARKPRRAKKARQAGPAALTRRISLTVATPLNTEADDATLVQGGLGLGASLGLASVLLADFDAQLTTGLGGSGQDGLQLPLDFGLRLFPWRSVYARAAYRVQLVEPAHTAVFTGLGWYGRSGRVGFYAEVNYIAWGDLGVAANLMPRAGLEFGF